MAGVCVQISTNYGFILSEESRSTTSKSERLMKQS